MNKKKIGIITEYSLLTTNYGNVLQTYALNSILRKHFSDFAVETVLFSPNVSLGWKVTSRCGALQAKIKSLFIRKKDDVEEKQNIKTLEKFQAFAKKIVLSDEVVNIEQLVQRNYDILIVGSDVVWTQVDNYYNSVKFLCYEGCEVPIKFSYAASLGKDYIPSENKQFIIEALNEFKGISVREKSSLKLLNSIGIHNALHVADPTLLIEKNEWRELAKQGEINVDKPSAYILVHRLNNATWQDGFIRKLSTRFDLPIVDTKDYFSDKGLGVDEWLCLIDNAEYIVTDSFHCLAFSSIFEKKFYVLEREMQNNLNNRMIDYLDTIGEKDKFIKKTQSVDVLDKVAFWNYESINVNKNKLITESMNFLYKMLSEK